MFGVDLQMWKFEELHVSDESKINEMSQLATTIVKEYYDPILGRAHNDYMLEKFQSAPAIKEQLLNGYSYYFVKNGDKKIGFVAICNREHALFLSKFYLCKEERGKGFARPMLAFVSQKARERGYNVITLNVNRFNNTVEIYKKLGFKIIGEEKVDIGGGYYMDDYVCALEL